MSKEQILCGINGGSSTPNETTSGYGKSPILDDLPIIHGGFP